MAVDGRQVVNVALNRPSYQSSVYSHDLGPLSANLANDGNRDADMLGGSCAHTLSQPDMNQWWAVDLLVPLYVDGVNFTNRARYGMYRTVRLRMYMAN